MKNQTPKNLTTMERELLLYMEKLEASWAVSMKELQNSLRASREETKLQRRLIESLIEEYEKMKQTIFTIMGNCHRSDLEMQKLKPLLAQLSDTLQEV
ncbi:MAG: hypothetical protein LBM04_07865 [Opitutaceae bacterium]|jgi:hypothetical protein|nr:hypothetical protein [Opitutaceae bacterium]